MLIVIRRGRSYLKLAQLKIGDGTAKRADIAADIDATTIQHNYNIWSYWSRAGREGKIGWGYFIAIKDA